MRDRQRTRYRGVEGFVYIQSDIHGIGGLDPAEIDWHNPVATIMVQKVK
jgi:hypothetical protein